MGTVTIRPILSYDYPNLNGRIYDKNIFKREIKKFFNYKESERVYSELDPYGEEDWDS